MHPLPREVLKCTLTHYVLPLVYWLRTLLEDVSLYLTCVLRLRITALIYHLIALCAL